MRRRALVPLTSLLLLVPAAGSVSAATAAAGPPDPTAARGPASDVLLDWQEIAIEAVYLRQPPPPAIPTGAVTLGFTSLAVHDAVVTSQRHGDSSEAAAAVNAAFHVLKEYVPDQTDYLREQRRESLEPLGDGKDVRVGERLGRKAAARMIASRVGDGRELAGKIVYDRPADPGIWQPAAPATAMAFAHLGFVDLLVLSRRVRVDGPDSLDSAAYAADFNEVKERGSNAPPADAAAERRAATANFFNFNSATMVGSAVIEHLRQEPMGVGRTAFLFAAMHGAMADSIIATWRLKFQGGYWRPDAAIHRADEDGNDATEPDPSWTALLPVPAYPEYPSGHAGLTAPAVEVVRQLLGERTRLALTNTALDETRTYRTLTRLETEASNSRIWGGLHFRDAMDDGYALGHRTARRVLRALG
jgi:hypothetical protein